MNKFLTTGAALLATTTMTTAGGLDRSGQAITAIFEDGNYVELSFGSVTPRVTGTLGANSGNMAGSYTTLGMAFKTDLNDQTSVALIIDQPIGANVDYNTAGYPLLGIAATLESTGLTALVRYEFDDTFSVHGGVRYMTANGNVNLTAAHPLGPYSATYSAGSGAGYVIGAAYERPDIAMRVALTYSSAIELELPHATGSMETTMPQSVNLDFQTGIAADTLLFGSIRWADWTETELNDSALAAPLLTYDQDVYTYTIGVGRRFSDTFSGALTLGYEKAQGGAASDLAPTDGNVSLSLGGTYAMGNGLELTGGVRYVWLGDATTTAGATFADNTVTAVGLKVAYNY